MSTNGSAANRAPRNFGLLLGCFLLIGCDAPPAQNAAPEIASNTADEPTGRPPAETTQNTASSSVAKELPADVIAFKARRDDCDHFRGEDPGDDETRASELTSKLEQSCKGTDAQLASLRRRYADDASVTAALAGYEDSVE